MSCLRKLLSTIVHFDSNTAKCWCRDKDDKILVPWQRRQNFGAVTKMRKIWCRDKMTKYRRRNKDEVFGAVSKMNESHRVHAKMRFKKYNLHSSEISSKILAGRNT